MEELKTVWIVSGTIEGANDPDYYTMGAFSSYENAKAYAVKKATEGFDKNDTPLDHRYCDYDKDKYLTRIMDGWDYYVYIRIEQFRMNEEIDH